MASVARFVQSIVSPRSPQPIYHPIVQELADWVSSSSDRVADFDAAIRTAALQDVRELSSIKSFPDYLHFLSSTLTWLPSENITGTVIFDRFGVFYFILSQPSVTSYLSPIDPSRPYNAPPSFLSSWIVRYGQNIGAWMDHPASLSSTTLAAFRACSSFHVEDYLEPRGGWRSFNDFFARHFKPGKRPIAHVADNTRIISPTDFMFLGQLPITPFGTVVVKGLTWRVRELVAHSPHAERFHGGIWLRGYLGTNDYHRVHAPVGGRVVEARTVLGLHHTEIVAKEVEGESKTAVESTRHEEQQQSTAPVRTLQKRRIFDCPNETGYQIFQSRGLVVLETEIGMVAVIPVGMAAVSSVVLTAEVGTELRKGEEIGYFQFGGSDMVVLLEAAERVHTTAEVKKHYKMGVEIGRVS